MKAVSFKEQNCVFAKHQPEYLQLPAHKSHDKEGIVISCYRLSFMERAKVLLTGRVWWSQLTFLNPLQPQRASVNKWDMLNKEFFEPKNKK